MMMCTLWVLFYLTHSLLLFLMAGKEKLVRQTERRNMYANFSWHGSTYQKLMSDIGVSLKRSQNGWKKKQSESYQIKWQAGASWKLMAMSDAASWSCHEIIVSSTVCIYFENVSNPQNIALLWKTSKKALKHRTTDMKLFAETSFRVVTRWVDCQQLTDVAHLLADGVHTGLEQYHSFSTHIWVMTAILS